MKMMDGNFLYKRFKSVEMIMFNKIEKINFKMKNDIEDTISLSVWQIVREVFKKNNSTKNILEKI